MPRSNKGGARQGTPGKAYPNRSDLNAQAVRTAPSTSYGQATQQANAQRAIPLPQTPAPAPPAVQQGAPGQAALPGPPDPGLLSAPTARPGEPVTAGLPIGAGPGPSALATGHPDDQVLANLYAAYQSYPTEGLRQLIEQTEQLRG